jgi:hypothetical protein
MKSIKNTKKIQAKRKKKTRKNQNNKRKTKKECCKFGSGRTRRKRKRNQKTCSICLEQIPRSQLITTGCNHHFHSNCLKIWCDTNELENEVTCPYCRSDITSICNNLSTKTCIICLQKILHGDLVIGDCGHHFHIGCFINLCDSNNNNNVKCPLCDYDLTEQCIVGNDINTIIEPHTPSDSPPSRFSSLSSNSSIDPLNDIDIYGYRRPFLTIEDLRVDDREPSSSNLESIFIPSSPEYPPPSPPFLTMEDLRVDEPQDNLDNNN